MILYSVIARAKDGAVLCESIVAGVEGNFPQITVEVLERIVSSTNALESPSGPELLPDGGRRTFVQRRDEPMFGGLFSGVASQWTCFGYNNADDVESGGGAMNTGDVDYFFHLCRKDNVICLCISDETDARHHAVNYDFLDDAEAKFTKSYAPFRVTKAKAYEMDKKFRSELVKLIYFYNENRRKMVMNDKVGDLLVKVDDLKGLVGRNITMVLERDRHLTDLVKQSEDMMQDSKVRKIAISIFHAHPSRPRQENALTMFFLLVIQKVFSKRSSKLKARAKREYYGYQIIAFLFGVLVLYLFFAEVCGYSGQKCSSNAGGRGGEQEDGGGR